MSRSKFWDPTGEQFGMPTWPRKMAPDGYATRRQLRAMGLRPGGQPVAGQLLWRSRKARRSGGTGAAWLYLVELALPVRPMTPGKQAGLDAAMRKRRTCPQCDQVRDYCIPKSLGICVECQFADEDEYAFAA
ncbi:RRQRL motif-containing zinc-binding protein [Kitasatospora sp. NPDC101155]|uniref:RRQRL motif-containing zinc-binding protein n=1 Tax=Kitasatospora sp. NPDC101155 TaxID=3364097 RepID=UPI00380E279D